MFCPKCGNEIVGALCSNCGYQIDKSLPEYSSHTNQQFSPSPASTPYQQSIQPSPHPDWYKDGSIMGLILVIISFIILWYLSTLFGLLFGLISLIIVVNSKKRNGRIFLLSIILTIIAFVIELILAGIFFFLVWSML